MGETFSMVWVRLYVIMIWLRLCLWYNIVDTFYLL